MCWHALCIGVCLMSTLENVQRIVQPARDTAKVSFWKAGHLPTLVGSFFYFDTSFMIWVLLGALGNHVAGSFGLTVAQKGFMTAIPLLAGSVLRLLLGVVGDSIGGKKAGLIGMTVTL